jgi:hypothetical protein
MIQKKRRERKRNIRLLISLGGATAVMSARVAERQHVKLAKLIGREIAGLEADMDRVR